MMPNPRIDRTTRCTALGLPTSRRRHAISRGKGVQCEAPSSLLVTVGHTQLPPPSQRAVRRRRSGYTVNKPLRSNEPQASERTQRTDRKDCQTNPHFKQARGARSACPQRDRGTALAAPNSPSWQGCRGERGEGNWKARCCHADMQAGCTHIGTQACKQVMHTLSTLGTRCTGTCTGCQ
jgi:hypothetical protein